MTKKNTGAVSTANALKMAIEALDEYPVNTGKLRIALEACKEALEKQEIGDAEIKQMLDDIEWYQQEQRKLINRIKELQQPAQEPVAWLWKGKFECIGTYAALSPVDDDHHYSIPLYTHPHQWQGLTDDERVEAFNKIHPDANISLNYLNYARAIEQALKKKNYS